MDGKLIIGIIIAVVVIGIYKILRICMLIDPTPSSSTRYSSKAVDRTAMEYLDLGKDNIKVGKIYRTVTGELVMTKRYDKDFDVWICQLSMETDRFVDSGCEIECRKEELSLVKIEYL